MKVFLGGTCNESKWRDELIPLLEKENIDYFNPVVDDWNEEAFQKELKEKKLCNVHLYTITPKMTGVYSIAELVEESIICPEDNGILFCILEKDEDQKFDEGQLRSLKQVSSMVKGHGTPTVYSLEGVMKILSIIKNSI